jgi:phosphatidylinositol alpha-1,6-mannosyltransferase
VKRVLLLTPACQGADGLSAYSRLCIDAFAAADVKLEVWSLAESNDRERPLPKSVKSWFAKGSKKQFAWRGLKSTFLKPDVVFCTHVNVAPIALPMTLFGSRLVVSLLGVEAWRPLRWRERAAIKRAKRLVAISQHTIDGFHAANPSLKNVPAEVCHLCLPGGPSAEDERRKAEQPFALIVARMSSEERYKGHDLLLEIWPDLLKRVRGARLAITGGGDDRPRLEGKRDALGLKDSVQFLGRVSDEDLQRLYRQCSFLVMPSRNEGFGLVFLEAMRAGKACIGAKGSASEIIVHGETGFVFDADDREGIMNACVQLFSDPDFSARLGEAGREREAKAFSVEAFRSRLLDLVFEERRAIRDIQ